MSKIRPPSESDNPQDRRTYAQRIEAAFPALCGARAYAYGQGEVSLQDAVDTLQDWAVTRGLVELVGQDEVQRMMAEAFAPYRDDLNG